MPNFNRTGEWGLSLIILMAWFLPSQSLAKGPNIIWHGQSFFEIVTGDGTRVAIDPHAIENYGRKTVKSNLVLLSHRHTDHTKLEAIENLMDARVLESLKEVKGDSRRTEFIPIDERIKGIRVRNIPCFHDDQQGMRRGRNSIWVIESDGIRIAHLGDLGHQLDAGQLRLLGPVDVLMIPVGGVYTLNGIDARRVVDQIKPSRHIIPMHYGTRVYTDLLGPEAFLEEFAEGAITRIKGNNFEVGFAPPPGQQKVVLLGWESVPAK